MSYHEKNTWAFGIIAVLGYATYAIMVVPRLISTPASSVDYAVPLFGTIAGAIVAGIIAGIALGVLRPGETTNEDERDRRISRLGDRVGDAFGTIGGVAAIVLAVVRADWFWIANVLYLCFVLAAVLSAVVKIVAYRTGVPRW